MGKFTKKEAEEKKIQARNLYIKGFDVDTISDTIGVSAITVAKWAKSLDFEAARKASSLALSEIRQTILDSFVAMRRGDKPAITPDAAAKFAKAFEQLSDSKKCLPYMYEAYEQLTDELMRRVQQAASKAAKERALSLLKEVRAVTQDILSRSTNEQLKTI